MANRELYVILIGCHLWEQAGKENSLVINTRSSFYCANFMRMAWIKVGEVIVLWVIRKQSHLFWR